jgi:hypothetical protein
MNRTIGADTEEELVELERDAQRLHECGALDADGLGHRRAVVAGIRRVRDSGREDLARHLLHAWRQHGLKMP